MAAIVVDPSVAAAWCFKEEASEYTEGVLSAVSGIDEACAPRLWAYELRNTVLVGVRRQRITIKDAREFLQSLRDLRIRLIDPLSYDGVFDLAERYGLTFYDASYLELALREGASLASLDDALRRAATKAGAVLFEP